MVNSNLVSHCTHCVPLKVPPQICSLIVVNQSSLKQQDGSWQQEQEATEATLSCGCTSDMVVVEWVGVESRSPPRTLASCTHPAPWAADVITCSHDREGDRKLLLKHICIILCANIWNVKIFKGRTCVLEIHVVAIQCAFQPVAHDLQLHYLLPDGHVWLGDVKLNLWIVDLIG